MANVQVANTDAQLTGKQLSVEGVFIAEGTIANAAIITLPTTPINLVAAPGSNKRIRFLWADLVIDCAGGAYGNVDTTIAYIYINLQNEEEEGSVLIENNSTPTPARTDLNDLLTTTNKSSVFLIPFPGEPIVLGTDGLVQLVTAITASSYNVPLQLICSNNGAGNFTGGNGSNTLKYKLAYVIEAF